MSKFPTDDATLHLLIGACQINPDTGRTHLLDFLDFGSIEKSRELVDEGGCGGFPVYHVEFEEGTAPFSPNQVIQTLAEELMEARHKAEEAKPA